MEWETDMSSYYTNEELSQIGLKKFGINVKISKKTSFYHSQNIIIGDHVRIDDFCVLSAEVNITLGNYIHIACFCALYGSSDSIVMEDFTTLSSRVVLYTGSDDYSGVSLTNPTISEEFRPNFSKGPVIIEKHAIIGTNSTILPSVTVGEGSAIGAHSLVTKSLERWGIYFGIPAKRIKNRKRDLLVLEKSFIN